jgi:hypothetical protein
VFVSKLEKETYMLRHIVLTILIAVNVSGTQATPQYRAPAAPQERDTEPIVLDMVYNNLGESPRVSAFNDPKTLAAWEYTGQVPHLYVQCAVTFDSLEQGVIEGFEESAAYKTPKCLRDISNHPRHTPGGR